MGWQEAHDIIMSWPSSYAVLHQPRAMLQDGSSLYGYAGQNALGKRTKANCKHPWRTPNSLPFVLDGLMTGETFYAHAEQFLAPALRPGDVVVMENCASTRSPGSKRDPRGPRQRPLPAGLQPRPHSDREMFPSLRPC